MSGAYVTASYNKLNQYASIGFGNQLGTTFGYWDVGGYYDTTGGYYGRLWEMQTKWYNNAVVEDFRYTWDAGGNLTERYNAAYGETESFTYDFLDRLTAASNLYTESYAYNEIGNITSKNGASYTYNTNGTRPRAVTAIGGTSYVYDNNGNMTTRGSQTLTWDVENRPE